MLHKCFTHRYYTSIPLTDTLLSHGTLFTGTVMKNRKELPAMIRDKKFTVTAGETVAFRDGRLLAFAWKAETKKKPLMMVNSGCSAKPISLTTRRGAAVSKPATVNKYNHCMNGVDVADQLTVFYSFVRKTKKWWRKLFFYFLEVAVVNSYIIYKSSVTHPYSHLRYRRAIVEQAATLSLLQAPPRAGPGAPRRFTREDLPQRLEKKQHFLGKLPKSRDCVVCSKREPGKRHRTIYFCSTCRDSPCLCPDTCFKKYHTLTKYKL